ncbi:MAG TPA: M48 family metallopeptidase [Gemmatimonadaceae bacterium]|nr:M48 family metallopeptidase [Gemmatimonadaceae bacterium]
MADRKILTDIASVAWEHPADRAALNALRAIPMFDEVVKKVVGFFGDTGVRNLFLANAVRVGAKQRPALDALYDEVVKTLDCPTRPPLYVTQTPFANAGAIGFNEPFIVINSGTFALMNREEQRFVLAHEVGHVMSGHVIYRTLAAILILVGLRGLPFLAGIALLPIQVALFEWYRKSELSSDRAGLLGSQSRDDTLMAFLKFAGGGGDGDTIDLDEFMRQAAEYETEGGAWDAVTKVLNTVFREHPFHTVRAAELERWIAGGTYAKILAGEYPKRSDATQKPLEEDFADAASYYGEQARAAVSKVSDMLGRAKSAFEDAFKGARR